MQNDKRVTTYLLVFLGFALLILFTKWAYSDLQLELSEKKINISTLEKLTTEKEKLNKIQKQMKDPENEIRKEIQRYTGEFSEDRLLNYFYRYAQGTQWGLVVKWLNLSTKDVNEYGFKEGYVNLNVSVTDGWVLLAFMRDILSENAEYRFFIDRLNIPKKQEWKNMEVNIPLKIFYK